MTGLLNDVMHERAERAGPPQLDLDAIVAAGDRRVRRGRTLAGLAAAAVAATVAVTGLAVPRLLGDDPAPAPATSPFAARELSWAQGSTIHWGGQTFDMGRTVHSYLQTDDGFVWTSPDGTVRLFDGSTNREIGRADGGYLVADDSGPLVAWTTPREGGRSPAYVVYDTAADEVVTRVDADPDDNRWETERVMGLDGTAAYWKQDDTFVRQDLGGGEASTLWVQEPFEDLTTKADPAITDIVDVAAGRIAYYVQRGDEWGLAVGETIEPDGRILSAASHGVLSPDGRYLASENDDFIAVHDTRTGEDLSPDLGSYPYAVGYAWVDDDTLMVYGLTSIEGDGPYPADLMTCDVGGGCTTETSEEIAEGAFALPVGEPLD